MKNQPNENLARLEALIKLANEKHVSPAELKEFVGAMVSVIKDLKQKLLNAAKSGDAELDKKIEKTAQDTLKTLEGHVKDIKKIILEANKNTETRHKKIEASVEKVRGEIPQMPNVPDITGIIKKVKQHDDKFAALPNNIMTREQFDSEIEIVNGNILETIKNLPKHDKAPMMHTPSIGNLPDVNMVGITVGQALIWNGTIFAPGNAGAGTWYVDVVLTRTNGTSYTLPATPTAVLFLFLNGQKLVKGVDYTQTGTAVTMTTPTLSTDIVTATLL